ncbi:hypothetical protein Tco_0518319 [Tanacetum coccineum]
MGRDTIQLENAVSAISQEYMLEFTSEYGIPEDLHPELPRPEDTIVDFPEDMDLLNLISAPNPTKVKTGTIPHGSCIRATLNWQERSKREGGKCTSYGFKERSCFRSPNVGYSWWEIASCHGSRSGTPLPYVRATECERSGPAIRTTTEIPTEGVATTEVNVQFPLKSPESRRSTSTPSTVGSPSGIYQPGWGVTNDCHLDTPEACQDMVDHTMPPGFEQEGRLLKKARAQVARRNERIQVREEEIKRLGEEFESLKVVETEVHGLRNQTKNLKTLLEAEVDMKKATEAKNAELAKELESLRAKCSDLQLNNNQLSQQVATLQAQVTGEEKIKAEFEDFKKYEDNKVKQRCTEMDARLNKLSVDIDEELYPHMLTAIAGRRWVIWHCLCLAVMKYAESTEIRQVFANVVSAGLAKGMSEGLKYDIDTEDPWAVKEEVSLEDAIAANISRAKKKKKCKVVCRTHGVGSAHYARSDGIPVSVPTVVPQGLTILLTDASTQTQRSKDEASPRLLRSKSLPPMYNLDWP